MRAQSHSLLHRNCFISSFYQLIKNDDNKVKYKILMRAIYYKSLLMGFFKKSMPNIIFFVIAMAQFFVGFFKISHISNKTSIILNEKYEKKSYQSWPISKEGLFCNLNKTKFGVKEIIWADVTLKMVNKTY